MAFYTQFVMKPVKNQIYWKTKKPHLLKTTFTEKGKQTWQLGRRLAIAAIQLVVKAN